MKVLIMVMQCIAGLGLLNVWILRFKQKTPYRGGSAESMEQEFAAYGLPAWFTYVIGFLKISAAIALLVGLWVQALVFPAAALLGALMIGALAMHFKIRDPIKKYMPASLMLAISLLICLGSN
jgi:uncharacterized membrane protein YphA (DoxX/SURF4 family)